MKKAGFLLSKPMLYIINIHPVIRSLYADIRTLVEPGKGFNGIGDLTDQRFAQFYFFEVEIVDGQYPLFAIGF